MSVVVDTSALFALLDRRDAHYASAAAFWADPDDEDLVTHAYVVVESVALVRARLGVEATVALVDDLLPALRVEMVDRSAARRVPGRAPETWRRDQPG